MRGQTTFELVIALMITAVVASVILSDTGTEALSTSVLASVRNVAMSQQAVGALNSVTCTGSHVRSVELSGNNITVDILACNMVNATKIADIVERNVCAAAPNGDLVIDCADKYYLSVKVS